MHAFRSISCALAFVVAMAASAVAAEQNDPSRFFGKYSGTTKTVFDADNKGVGAARKSEVEIRAAQEGRFVVRWSTDIPGRAQVARQLRDTTMEFAPTGTPNVWRALRTGNPLFGQALIWARVGDKALTIYIVAMLKNGVMVTATYRRVVDGDRMMLEFERTEDGKRRRAVEGTLARVKG